LARGAASGRWSVRLGLVGTLTKPGETAPQAATLKAAAIAIRIMFLSPLARMLHQRRTTVGCSEIDLRNSAFEAKVATMRVR
jgi:hypothetical protein